MIGRSRPAILLATLLVAACSISLIRQGELDLRAARRIVHGIAELRGLSFLSPVPMEVKSTDALRAFLKEEIDRQYSPEEIVGLGRVYERLGLLAPNVDLGVELLKLYSTQVAGFYDPRSGKLYLVETGLPSGGWLMTLLQFVLQRDLVGEMILAHELTHALQDQHFSVLGLTDDSTNEDRALAASAVVEGDATLSGFAYVFGGLPTPSLLEVVQRLQAIPLEVAATLPDTPPALREALIFRYTAGANFVAWAYLRGGWTAVDALLANPPTSTEQLLWPEKYFVTPDDATEIQLGGLDEYRSSRDWSLVEENSLGELMIRVQAREFLSESRAIEVARGWDGDRFVAFTQGRDLRVFWMSIWDTERDAEEFLEAEREILTRTSTSPSERPDDRSENGEGSRQLCSERQGNKVLIALGIPPDRCATSLDSVWSTTVFLRGYYPLDLDLARAEAARDP